MNSNSKKTISALISLVAIVFGSILFFILEYRNRVFAVPIIVTGIFGFLSLFIRRLPLKILLALILLAAGIVTIILM